MPSYCSQRRSVSKNGSVGQRFAVAAKGRISGQLELYYPKSDSAGKAGAPKVREKVYAPQWYKI